MQFYSDKVEKLFKTKEELDESVKKFSWNAIILLWTTL